MNGICTLGNDQVYHQLVALINSIEAFAGPAMPICIYPYDDQIDQIRQLVAHRPQVQLWEDPGSLQRWDRFVEEVWATHPTARDQWQAIGSVGIHRRGTHRRFCAFDGPFDRFFYMDADTLLLSPPDGLFTLLATHDWVTYDFQYKDLSHVYAVNSPRLKTLFSPEQLHQQAFCSGFYGSHRGRFDPDTCQDLLGYLTAGDAEVLYPMAPDQTLLNYLVMRRELYSCNLAHTLPPEQRTGNAVTSRHFQVKHHRVYDQGLPLTYLHYIGLPSQLFSRLCQGENVDFPYRQVFLHYRYRHAPESRPALAGKLIPYRAARGWRQQVKSLLPRSIKR